MRYKPFIFLLLAIISAISIIYLLFSSANARFLNKKLLFNTSQSLDDISSFHLTSSIPLCLIILDTRANIAVVNSGRLLNYFGDCPVKVEPIVMYVNSAPISNFSNTRQLEKGTLDGYDYKKDFLYLFNSHGRLRYNSPLTRDVKAILTELDEILLGNNSSGSHLKLKVGDNIQSSMLSKVVNSSFERERFCFYIIFTDLCISCKSGNSLIEIDNYCKKKRDIRSTFIAVNEYSNRDIDDFKLRNGIDSEIISPSSEFLESWRNIELQIERNHPWDGAILVVNQAGIVVFVSKDAGDCIK